MAILHLLQNFEEQEMLDAEQNKLCHLSLIATVHLYFDDIYNF
ncbi:hypothetical protein ENHY17A_200141 [Moraxellaceae bacterium 17A]|nr:hypothetical protein ENHY17A_200141 [Moraxellaceae bacterium 17A]